MGINVVIIELILLSTVFSKALAATVENQEQMQSNENQPLITGLGSASSLGSSPAASKIEKLTETMAPGKSSRYIIRFARMPNSQIRFSRSPSSQIRFGRSQPFVRFGRNSNDDIKPNPHYSSSGKFIRFARNGIDDLYNDGDSIQVEPRGRESNDNGFIRFGRSGGPAISPLRSKNDALRSIHWRNFLRLGRNTNANIRFAGKRDGSSTTHRNVPLEMLIEKFAHDQKANPDLQDLDQRNLLINDDEELEDFDVSPEQRHDIYSNDNDLEQN